LESIIDTPLNLRDVGRLRVLQALHEGGRTSRTELVKLTGLSRATVSALVADLMAAGLVQEEAGPPIRRPGRPAGPHSRCHSTPPPPTPSVPTSVTSTSGSCSAI